MKGNRRKRRQARRKARRIRSRKDTLYNKYFALGLHLDPDSPEGQSWMSAPHLMEISNTAVCTSCQAIVPKETTEMVEGMYQGKEKPITVPMRLCQACQDKYLKKEKQRVREVNEYSKTLEVKREPFQMGGKDVGRYVVQEKK